MPAARYLSASDAQIVALKHGGRRSAPAKEQTMDVDPEL